jgi:hypothetical protein
LDSARLLTTFQGCPRQIGANRISHRVLVLRRKMSELVAQEVSRMLAVQEVSRMLAVAEVPDLAEMQVAVAAAVRAAAPR